MPYVSFDGLVDRFSQQIYQSRKGRLRMHLIDALYQKYLPLTALPTYQVLDAAGGLGQMSHWFLSHGSRVRYFDIATEMVDKVATTFAESIQANRLMVEQASITQFDPQEQFDLVNAHAVLEWLEQPEIAIDRMMDWLKPGGYLGLMVYNKHMLMLRHLMRGTLDRAMSGDIGGDKKGLTPISPLDPLAVVSQLQGAGLNVICQAGVRSFSDLTEKTVLDWYDEEAVFEAELALCEQRPYCDMARYVLLIAQKPG